MLKKLFLPFLLAFLLPLFSLSASPETDFTFNAGTHTITGYIGPGGDVDIPSTIGGVNVTTIGTGAFQICPTLAAVTIPSGVTKIDDVAFNAASLTRVTIPDSVTWIGRNAFYSCASLTSITISDKVTSIGDGAFSGCTSLAGISVHPNNTYYSSDNGVLFNKDKTCLIQCPGGKTGIYDVPPNVTSIGYFAFVWCNSLTKISIPASTVSFGITPFYACSSLTEISVHSDNPNYSSENGILFNKNKTILIQCPGGKPGIYNVPSNVISIEDKAFAYCSLLNSITIPQNVTSIGIMAFIGCSSLTEIMVDLNNSNYSSLDGVLFNKDKTTLISCTSKKTGNYIIPSGVTTIGQTAFWDCNLLTSIKLPSTVTSISDHVFVHCTSLTSITIPSSVTSIGGVSFFGCTSLISAFFNGNAPSSDNWSGMFDKTAPGFNIYYKTTKTGFTTPAWHGYPCNSSTFYDVTFSAGSNGSITGPTFQTVNQGSSCTEVTAIPSFGYYFVNWSGSTSSYENLLTVSNVSSNMALTANFAPMVTNNANSGAGSLRQIIADAAAGETIGFASNIGTITLSSEIVINKSLTIDSMNPEDVVISGNNACRIFKISGTGTLEIFLSGLTLQNGLAAQGGAIYIDGADNSDKTVFIENCIIKNNKATQYGGAIFADSSASAMTNLFISGSTLSANTAEGTVSPVAGGAIYGTTHAGSDFANLSVLSVAVIQSTMTGNIAKSTSGPCIVNGGATYMTKNASNFAFSTISIYNSTIAINDATNTVTAANGRCGGVYLDNADGNTGDAYYSGTLASSIVAGNTDSNITTTYGPDICKKTSVPAATIDAASSYNLIGTSGGSHGITNGSNNNKVVAITGLQALADYGGDTPTMALTSGSNAKDAGSTAALQVFITAQGFAMEITTDQRGYGYSRSLGSQVDIGAFELMDPLVNHTVTFNVFEGGTIAPAGKATQNIPHGSPITDSVTATPDTGYTFRNWTGTNFYSTVQTITPAMIDEVVEDLTITANFDLNSYTVNYLVGENGSITGDTTQTVLYGYDSTPVFAVPDTGYHFVSWSDLSVENPRTDNITSALSVTANFALNDINSDLVAYYPFDGNADDMSGNGHDGTINGTVTSVADHLTDPGKAYSFGDNNYIEVPHAADLCPTTQITICAWVKLDSTTGIQPIVNKEDSATGPGYTLEFVSDTNNVRLIIDGLDLTTNAVAVPIGEWHYITAVYDGTKANVFVDGMGDDWVYKTGAIPTTTNPLNIGRDMYNNKYIDGCIDEVRIYNRALAPEEFQMLNSSSYHVIAASAGANGSIAPSGSINILEGDDRTYTITANQYYHVADVLVDGSSEGDIASYEFTNVNSSHTISATFAHDTATITMAVDIGGGSTTPAEGPHTVDTETPVDILATPLAGYHFLNWTTSGNCTFNDANSASATATLSANAWVIAHFALNTPGFTLGSNSMTVNENAGTGTFTAVLTTQPVSDVVFDVTSSDAGQATISPASLTFTTANWNTPQEVTITGVDDDVLGNHSATITVAVNRPSSPPNYIAVADKTVSVTCRDDEFFAIPMDIVWDKTFGGSSSDKIYSLIQASDGGYILGGPSSSNISGEKNENSRGLNDYWVVKTDANGNREWDKTFGGSEADELYSITQTPDGGYLLGGYSMSGISGDKTGNLSGINDRWVVKIDSTGNKQWDKAYGGTGSEGIFTVISLSGGSAIITGSSNSDSSGDKTENSKGNDDFWIVKIASDGTKLWDKTIGGDSYDSGCAIAQTSDGGFLLAGSSMSGISGDKSEISRGGYDFWIVKIDSLGNKQWDKTYGGSAEDNAFAVVQNTDGDFYIGGESRSGMTGDKTAASYGDADYWVVKIDASGNKLWDKTFGGTAEDRMTNLVPCPDGGVMLTGHSASPVSGNKTSSPKSSDDFWVVKVDSSGNKQWERAIGGSIYQRSYKSIYASGDSLLVAGRSMSNISGDKSESCRGSDDFWVVKMGYSKYAVSKKAITLAENGGNNTFNVVLNAKPATDVVFDVSSSNTDEATVSPSAVTFTSANWNTPQAVTVTGVNDSKLGTDSANVTVSVNAASSDDAFDDVPNSVVAITCTNDDAAGMTLSKNNMTIGENGGQDTFTVVLTAQPLVDVVLDVSSSTTAQATVSPSQLTFTSLDWNTPQTVTVTGVNDSLIGDHAATIAVAVNDALSDNGFDAVADKTVAVTCTDNDFTLAYSAGANGSIAGTASQIIDSGTDGSAVTAVADEGYHFVDWSDAVATASRTDTGVTGNITVTANFAVNVYTVTYIEGANGTITGTKVQTINHGSDATGVTAVPDAGCHFVNWSDGILTAARTETSVTADKTVTANFAINTYTLTYNAGANGSITGTTPQTVNHGANGSAVTAVPDAGYQFVKWSDGVLTAARTDTNVTSDLSVSAQYVMDITTNNATGNGAMTQARYLVNLGFEGGHSVTTYLAESGLYDYSKYRGNNGNNWWLLNDGSTAAVLNTYGDVNQGGATPPPDFFGYKFKHPVSVSSIVYNDYCYGDGGTFNGTPSLQYLPSLGGAWTTVAATWDQPYNSSFAGGRQVAYTITPDVPLENILGIRLYGDTTPSGAWDSFGWACVTELQVYGTPNFGPSIHFESNLAQTGTPICSNSAWKVANGGIEITDGNFDNSNEVWDAGEPSGTKFVGISWATPQDDVGAIGFGMTFNADGGWFVDTEANPLKVQYTTDGSTWQDVKGVDKGRYTADYSIAAALGYSYKGSWLFSFDITSGVLGVRLIGLPGGNAGALGGNGYVSIREMQVFQVVLDTMPDAFAFTDQTNVKLSTVITSNAITVNGINSSIDISIESCTGTDGQYQINGGSWTSDAGTVNHGDTVKVRQASSAAYSTQTDLVLDIGGVTDTFSVTTGAACVLTYNAGAHGKVNGLAQVVQTVTTGSDGTPITVVSDTGYYFVDWSDSSTGNPRTDSGVTGDITVTANYAINVYTLTYIEGANGTITGTKVQAVNHGSDATEVTAVPGVGYHFAGWSDYVLTAARTEINVTANKTVTANFSSDLPSGNFAQFNNPAAYDDFASHILVPSSNELKVSTALTAEVWIKPASGGGEWGMILGKQLNPANGNPWNSYRLYVNSANPSERGFPRLVAFNVAPEGSGEVGVSSTTVVPVDVWTHIAGVFDGATIKIYINGVLEGTVSQPNPLQISDLPLYIGRAPWSGYNNYNGQMDEIRIWNVARTQEEIQYAMKRSLVGNENGLVSYWRFDDTPGSGTTDDSSPNSNIGTLNNGAAIVANSTAPLGLVSWWKAEDNAFDSIGGYHGTMQNGAGFADGRIERAFSLTGTGDYVDAGTNDVFNFNSGAGDFTINAWIKLASFPSTGIVASSIMCKSTLTPSFSGWSFYVYPDGKLGFGGVGIWELTSGAGTIATGNWTHVVVTKNGSVYKLYKNGVEVASVDHGNIETSSAPLRIGSDFVGLNANSDPEDDRFNGLIDQVEIHNRALSAAEITTLYEQGDTTPAPFIFTAQTGIPLNTLIVSDTITVTGINYPTPISITGGEYAISTNGGSSWSAWTSSDGTLYLNNKVKLHQTSSVSNSTMTTATLAIGGVSAGFDVTTASAGDPNASGLVSWWKADNNALDSVSGNHGSLQGGATFDTGQVGQAFSFDGVDDYVCVPASSNLAFGTGDFAVGFWMYETTNDDRRPLISNRRNAVGTDGMWSIEIYNLANRVEFHSGTNILLTATNLLNNSSWNHIAVTRNGTTLSMYVNGVPSGSVTNTHDFSESNDIQIGRDILPANDLGGKSLNGRIDEVKIFNRSLSAGEVADLSGMVPDAFSFTAQTDMPLNTLIVSNPITVAGISYPTAISTTVGEYSVSADGGSSWSSWTATAGTVNLNDQVKLRQTSSAVNSFMTTATLTIGGVTADFDITTADAGDPNASGLISWWKAEDNALDSVSGYHGTIQNGATFANGRDGRAFSFDGADDSISVGMLGNIAMNENTPFTISAWINPSTTTGVQVIADNNMGEAGGSGNYSTFLHINEGSLVFGVNKRQDQDALITTPISTGWHFITATYSGTDLALYVDGELAGSAIRNFSGASDNTRGWYIGAWSPQRAAFLGVTGSFNGLIDEVKIFNRELSAGEASELSGMVPDAFSFTAQTGMPLNTVIVSNPITVTGTSYPTTISITAGGEYSISTDGGTTWGAWTSSGNVSPNNKVKLRQTSSASNSTETTATLTIGGVSADFDVTTAASGDPNASGLVAWWRAEDNALDSVGGHDGTLYGGIAYASGNDGRAFSLDGADGSRISVPDDTALNITGDVTVTAWVKRGAPGEGRYEHLLNKGASVIGSVDVPSSYVMQFSNDDRFVGGFERDDGSNELLYGSAISDTNFHHLAYVRNGGEHSLYVDGQMVGSTSFAGTPGNTSGLELTLGACNDDTGFVEAFKGRLDEVKIYNRALTASEIVDAAGPLPAVPGLRLWLKADAGVTKDGSGLISNWADRSGNGFDVGQGDGAKQPLFVSNAANGQPAVRFDGINDYLQTPGAINLIAGTANYSMFVVTKPGATQRTHADIVDFSHGSNMSFVLQQNADDTNQFGFINWQPLSSGAYQVFSDVYVNNTSYTSYLNGINGIQSTTFPALSWTEPNYFTVGNKSQEAFERQFNGDVSEVIIYNSSLSDADRQKVENYLIEKYGIDMVPEAFTFVDQTGAALNTDTDSNAVTVTGIHHVAEIHVAGGKYQINGGSWTSDAGTVRLNDSVRVRVKSAATTYTTVEVTLTIGGVSDTFAVTTGHALTYTAGANGSITGNLDQIVARGSDGTAVTALPDANCFFMGWSDSVMDYSPRQDTNVQADINVTASFLASGTVIGPLAMDQGEKKYYRIHDFSGQNYLKVELSGFTGDCDLYVMNGDVPTFQLYTAKSTNGGNNTESLTMFDDLDGDWYIMLHAYEGFTGANLTITYNDDSITEPTNFTAVAGDPLDKKIVLDWDIPATGIAAGYEVFRCSTNDLGLADKIGDVTAPATAYTDELAVAGYYDYFYWVRAYDATGICSRFSGFAEGKTTTMQSNTIPLKSGTAMLATGAAGSVRIYSILVPDAQTLLEVKVSGGTGDCDFDVVNPPPASETVKRVIGGGSAGLAQIANPAEGTWKIILHGLSNYAGVSVTAKYIKQIAVPAAPAGVNASDGLFGDRIVVTWTATPGATSYFVARNTLNSTIGATDLGETADNVFEDNSDTVTSALPGTMFYYFVKANNPVGPGIKYSAGNSGYIMKSPLAPGAPLASDGTYFDKIRVTWAKVAGATGYEVYRAETAIGVKTLVGVTTALFFDDYGSSILPDVNAKGVHTAKKYYYWIGAKSQNGPAIVSSKFNDGYLSKKGPAAITASKGIYSDRVIVTWAAVPGATSYDVCRYTDKLLQTNDKTVSKITKTSYEDETAVAGTPYYYRVKANYESGSPLAVKYSSDFSLSILGQALATGKTYTLDSGNPSDPQSDGIGNSKYFSVDVPIGTTRLVATIDGGPVLPDNDCDLFAKFANYPTKASYGAKGVEAVTVETITVSNPAAGTWYFLLYGTTAYSGVTLKVTCYTVADIVLTQVPASDLAVPFTASFVGKVVDESGVNGIPNIVVRARNPITGAVSMLTKTDAKGVFKYSALINSEGEHTFDFFFTDMPDTAKGTASHAVATRKGCLETNGYFDMSAYIPAEPVALPLHADVMGLQNFLDTRNGWDDDVINNTYATMWIDCTVAKAKDDAKLAAKLDEGLYMFFYGVEGAGVGNDTTTTSALSAVPFMVHVVPGATMATVLTNLKTKGIIDATQETEILGGKTGIVSIAALSNFDDVSDGSVICLIAPEQLELLAKIADGDADYVEAGKYSNVITNLITVTLDNGRMINVVTAVSVK